MFIFSIICSFFISKKKEYTTDSKFYRGIFNALISITLFFSRVKLNVSGLDKLPEDKKYLLVQNHTSNFDPIILLHIFKRVKLNCVSKKENFDIPFYGRYLNRLRFLCIERDNPRQSVRTLKKAADYISAENAPVVIYPEGTRNKNNRNELLPFHDGIFKVALMAKCPIAVSVQRNDECIAKNFPFKKTNVSVNVVKVIPYEEICEMNTHEISDIVRKIMENNLN